jgi:hypothetical protein
VRCLSAEYRPRRPQDGVVYQVVREHYETFRADAAARRDGEPLPRFIDEEFRGFLRCGHLAAGFARFRCETCRHEHLLPFSCKGRAVCPSCGGRRMAERAAHLVDHVFPRVPVRQWVLSLPHRLRYVLAWDHALCRAVVGVYMRAVLGDLRRRARLQGVRDGRSGGVAILQRFGAALNLNVHVHALVLDGVFSDGGDGRLSFHGLEAPTEDAMERVLAVVAGRIGRLLERRGHGTDWADDGAEDAWRGEAAGLAGVAAASVQGRAALGVRAGARTRRIGAAPEWLAEWTPPRLACHARADGYDLHAGVVVPAADRARLERVCRYALRPPLAADRVQRVADGDVILELRHRWADGTTHLRFDPFELLERLAALTPRPRINLVLYYGVLGARAAWRRRVCPGETSAQDVLTVNATPSAPAGAPGRGRWNMLWAELMQRSFGFDPLVCGRCAGRLRLLAIIETAGVVRRILTHLGLPTEVPAACPPRAPPLDLGEDDCSGGSRHQSDEPA